MKITFIIALFFSLFTFSQNENYYAGVEIGTNGMKTTILQLKDIKKASYTFVDSWSENYPFGVAISKNGKSLEEDINKTILLIQNNFEIVRISANYKETDRENHIALLEII